MRAVSTTTVDPASVDPANVLDVGSMTHLMAARTIAWGTLQVAFLRNANVCFLLKPLPSDVFCFVFIHCTTNTALHGVPTRYQFGERVDPCNSGRMM